MSKNLTKLLPEKYQVQADKIVCKICGESASLALRGGSKEEQKQRHDRLEMLARHVCFK